MCNFCNYVYNYTVDPSLTPLLALKPNHTIKPDPNLSLSHLDSNMNTKCIVLNF